MQSKLNYINWLGEAPSKSTLEAVSGAENFQHPSFLKNGWDRSRCVGLIPSFGTAFLIGPNTIMTNWHVFRRDYFAAGKTIAFEVELGEDGLPLTPAKYDINPDALFYSSEELDVCVVAVDGNPADTRGYVDLLDIGSVAMDGRVNIVQHPLGGLKKIAIRENGVKYIGDNTIQYWTDTEHGSSGSPTFDDSWKITGLHFQHDSAPSELGESTYFNEAHRMDQIVDHLIQNGISWQ